MAMRQEMKDLTSQMLTNIYLLVTDMINDPAKDMELGVAFAQKALSMWETLVKTGSQNPVYALQNLSEADRERAKQTRHKLLLLHNTYGPKSES